MVRVLATRTTTAPTTPLLVNPGGLVRVRDPTRARPHHQDLAGRPAALRPHRVRPSAAWRCPDRRSLPHRPARGTHLTAASARRHYRRRVWNQANAAATHLARDCERATDGLQFFDTITRPDMDQLRAALGQRNVMNYLGFSYGTELGSTSRTCSRAGRVSSSSTARSTRCTSDVETVDRSSSQGSRTRSGASPRPAGDLAVLRARRPDHRGGGATSQRCAPAVAHLLEPAHADRQHWRPPASTRRSTRVTCGHDSQRRSSRPASDAPTCCCPSPTSTTTGARPEHADLIDAFNTISCDDSAPGRPTTRSATPPRTGSRSSRCSASGSPPVCSHASPGSRTVRCRRSRPRARRQKVLVLGNIHDPATPYQGAIDLADTMGNAEVLSWNGEGHTSYLNGSKCVDNYVNAYLVSRSLPPDHTTCPA